MYLRVCRAPLQTPQPLAGAVSAPNIPVRGMSTIAVLVLALYPPSHALAPAECPEDHDAPRNPPTPHPPSRAPRYLAPLPRHRATLPGHLEPLPRVHQRPRLMLLVPDPLAPTRASRGGRGLRRLTPLPTAPTGLVRDVAGLDAARRGLPLGLLYMRRHPRVDIDAELAARELLSTLRRNAPA